MPTNKQAIDWITRTIAVLAFACVVTICVMSYLGKQIPPELNTLTGGLVGSLGSMLVKTTPTEDKKVGSTSTTPSGTVMVPEQKLETTENHEL